MRRRDFVGIVTFATAWPLAARAQPAKLPIIAFLGDSASGWSSWTAAFVERLREIGWIDGQTVAVEYRWSEGRSDRVAKFAADFVQQNVNVIVTYGAAIVTLKRTITSIPIVFALAVDPIGAGLVASLSRPGGNITGMSMQGADTAAKRLELLREVVPRLRRLAIMFDGDYAASAHENEEAQVAARALGFDTAPYAIRRAGDIAPAFEAIKSRADALYVVEDGLVFANRAPIVTLALKARLPTSFNERVIVQAGGLMSYGPSYPALFRRAAEIVDKILRGTNPGDIPVEQPTKFELVINLKTAKALGLDVPSTLLATADELIE